MWWMERGMKRLAERIRKNSSAVTFIKADRYYYDGHCGYYYRYTIDSIDFMRGNTHLTRIELSEVQLKDISPLRNNREVTYLDLSRNPIEDITPLGTMSSLVFIDLNSCKIKDIPPLNDLTALERLVLDCNLIKDVSSLSRCFNLVRLSISMNRIEDISPLSHLESLQYLVLSCNPIKSIAPLSPLQHLDELFLQYILIDDISPLKSCTCLRIINICDTDVRDISVITQMRVQHLSFDRSDVRDMTPIMRSSSLTSCDNRSVEIQRHLSLNRDNWELRIITLRSISLQYIESQK